MFLLLVNVLHVQLLEHASLLLLLAHAVVLSGLLRRHTFVHRYSQVLRIAALAKQSFVGWCGILRLQMLHRRPTALRLGCLHFSVQRAIHNIVVAQLSWLVISTIVFQAGWCDLVRTETLG